jgi:hypothetical protein
LTPSSDAENGSKVVEDVITMVLEKCERRDRNDGELSCEVIPFLRRKPGLGCVSETFGAEKVHDGIRAAYTQVFRTPFVLFRRVQVMYAHSWIGRLVGAERQLKSGFSDPPDPPDVDTITEQCIWRERLLEAMYKMEATKPWACNFQSIVS